MTFLSVIFFLVFLRIPRHVSKQLHELGHDRFLKLAYIFQFIKPPAIWH